MKYAKALLFIISSGVCALVYINFGRSARERLSIQWKIDSCCSPFLKTLLCDNVRTALLAPYSVLNLLEKLSTDYGIIESLFLSYCTYQRVAVTIQLYQPIIKINDDMIVCKNGSVYPIEWFDAHAVADVVAIRSLKNMPISPECYQWFINNDMRFLTQYYDVFIENHTKILLKARHGKCSLMCTSENNITDKIIKCVETLVEQRKDEKFLKSSNFDAKDIIADIRFDKQVVLYRKRGGMYEGEGLF